MKKLFAAFSFVLFPIATLLAQPSPESETSGQVTLADNSVQTGTIKDNIRKKGELIITSDGKKTKLKSGDITAAKLGETEYITRNYTFYEVIWQGNKICLLRKASEPSGLQYNGADAVVITSEGKIDDYFVKNNASNSFQIITKKNAAEVLKSICASCSVPIDASKFNINSVKEALQACDICR